MNQKTTTPDGLTVYNIPGAGLFVRAHEHNSKASELKQQHETLLAAAVGLLRYRNGCLPTRGWLNDTRNSRAALERLAEITKEQSQSTSEGNDA